MKAVAAGVLTVLVVVALLELLVTEVQLARYDRENPFEWVSDFPEDCFD